MRWAEGEKGIAHRGGRVRGERGWRRAREGGEGGEHEMRREQKGVHRRGQGRGQERGWREVREWGNEWGVMLCLSLCVSNSVHRLKCYFVTLL